MQMSEGANEKNAASHILVVNQFDHGVPQT
jgi:hypothetical protein